MASISSSWYHLGKQNISYLFDKIIMIIYVWKHDSNDFWKKIIQISFFVIDWLNKTINEMTVDGLTPWVLPKAQKSGKIVVLFICILLQE